MADRYAVMSFCYRVVSDLIRLDLKAYKSTMIHRIATIMSVIK